MTPRLAAVSTAFIVSIAMLLIVVAAQRVFRSIADGGDVISAELAPVEKACPPQTYPSRRHPKSNGGGNRLAGPPRPSPEVSSREWKVQCGLPMAMHFGPRKATQCGKIRPEIGPLSPEKPPELGRKCTELGRFCSFVTQYGGPPAGARRRAVERSGSNGGRSSDSVAPVPAQCRPVSIRPAGGVW